MDNWYEKLFENYAHQYDKESFVSGTAGECDFIEEELGFIKGSRILDIGCGTGRHSIELTRRGYTVTGVDLSESQLRRAKEKALEQNLSVDFQKQDARDLPYYGEFNMAIMICEGAFPLMETDEMNYQILKSASRALKSKGKLIFTTLNGLFPVFHPVGEFLKSDTDQDNASYNYTSFDLMTFRYKNITSFTDDSGNKFDLECNERYYIPSEITWLLKSLEFTTIDIFGAKLGAFSRDHKLSTGDFEMLVIAVKS